jgi:two-component system cell cycle response regulator DivK
MQDAIRCATEESVALILMDIGIPDKPGGAPQDDGGLDVTRVLKAQADTKAIPIVATSAFAMLDEKQRFLEAGCNDVQSKPYEFSALIQAINQQLKASD